MVDFLWEEFLQILREMCTPHSIIEGQTLLYRLTILFSLSTLCPALC